MSVWNFHRVFSDTETQTWVQEGCTTASIGCIDCKKRVIGAVQAFQAPILEKARELEEDPTLVDTIINEGSEFAREIARETLIEVREVMGMSR